MPHVHLAARATPGNAPFESFKAAKWTWARLRVLFPDPLAVVLMPNHLQFIAAVDDVDDARTRVARTLGHLQRWWAPGREIWERVRTPKIVVPGQPLLRELRYISLNPPRARLCRDPLEWPWTTHRDVIGAVVDPWVSLDRFAHATESSAPDLRAWWHSYVSGDPSVAVAGTPLPQPASPSDVPSRPVHEILCAVGAALRTPASRVRLHVLGPRLFLALARDQGWKNTADLAAALGMSQRHARRELSVDPDALRVARFCLGDRRLWSPFAEDEPARRKPNPHSGAPPRRDEIGGLVGR